MFVSRESLPLISGKLESVFVDDDSFGRWPISRSGKLQLRTSSAAAAFMRPCLATLNKQHGENAPVAPQGPSSTVTHSWVLRRTLPVCQLACLCCDTGSVGGWEEGHMCAVLRALGCLQALRVFLFLFLWTEAIEYWWGVFLRADLLKQRRQARIKQDTEKRQAFRWQWCSSFPWEA